MLPFATTANGLSNVEQEPIPVSKSDITTIHNKAISSDLVAETLTQLYSESAIAKIWALALEGLGKASLVPFDTYERTQSRGANIVATNDWATG